MANTTIRLKKSSVASHLPSPEQLEHGEIALNYADGKIFYKDAVGDIQQISGSANTFYTVNANGTYLVATSPTDILNINAGDNVEIVGDFLTDTFTIGANLKSVYDVANASFGLANSLFDSANTFNTEFEDTNSKLNVAFEAANAAYNAANAVSGGVDITGLYNTLNSAYVVANSSYDYANSIGTYESASYTVANDAFNTANAALANVSGAVFNGTLKVSGNVSVANARVVAGDMAITSAAYPQIVDSFDKTEYRTVKYLIQGTNTTDIHSTEVLLTHNDSTLFMTEYGTIFTSNSELYIVSANVYLNNVNLLVTAIDPNIIIDFYKVQLIARPIGS